jgi:hypothetical protein
VAADRLAQRLRHDVADTRVRMEEVALRSDAYLLAGHPEAARAVLDEQQALVAALEERVAASVAAAAVEADAERVLAASDDGRRFFRPVPAPARSARRSVPARAALSVLVSAVAALAFLVMVTTPPGPQTLAAAGVDDRRVPDRSVPGEGPSRSSLDAPAATDRPGPSEGARESEIRRLFTSPAPGSGPGTRSSAGADGVGAGSLQTIVDGLIASVVRAVDEVADEVLDRDARRLEAARTGDGRVTDRQPDGSAEDSVDDDEHDGTPPRTSEDRGADTAPSDGDDVPEEPTPASRTEDDTAPSDDQDGDEGHDPDVEGQLNGDDGLL